MNSQFRLILLVVLAFGTMSVALAHSVWIEPYGNQLVIRFAEPDGRFEKSPGYLDSLSAPVAFTLVARTPASVEARKQADHFLLIGASPTNAAGVETAFTVRAGRKPNFYARWQSVGVSVEGPRLTLDLVPTGKPGEVRAYFRGQPLGGIKATLRTPDTKEQELVADAQGYLQFASTQKGLHLLTVAHYRENLAGFYGGQPYEQTSHNVSLAWSQELETPALPEVSDIPG